MSEDRRMDPVPNYGAGKVAQSLDFDGCIDVVRSAMTDLVESSSRQPLRNIMKLDIGKLFGVMPGFLAAPGPFGAKIVSVFDDPDRPGRSSHKGVVVLFDPNDGRVTCIADAEPITEIRTGAASAVATDVLARPNAARLTIFGNGTQARTHALAISRIRPLDEIIIWGRNFARAKQFASDLRQETGLNVITEPDPQKAAAKADIICTVTTSATPILYGDWVLPGTHVNLVGSSFAGPVEVDTELVRKGRYFVDSQSSALSAASEFLEAKEAGLISNAHIIAEIGDVILGRNKGRLNTKDITIYKSLGHIVQDLAAVNYLHDKETHHRPNNSRS